MLELQPLSDAFSLLEGGCRSAQWNSQLPGVLEKKLHWKESRSSCLAFLAPGVTSKCTPVSWVPEELPGPSMVFAPAAFPTELLPEGFWGFSTRCGAAKQVANNGVSTKSFT